MKFIKITLSGMIIGLSSIIITAEQLVVIENGVQKVVQTNSSMPLLVIPSQNQSQNQTATGADLSQMVEVASRCEKKDKDDAEAHNDQSYRQMACKQNLQPIDKQCQCRALSNPIKYVWQVNTQAPAGQAISGTMVMAGARCEQQDADSHAQMACTQSGLSNIALCQCTMLLKPVEYVWIANT